MTQSKLYSVSGSGIKSIPLTDIGAWIDSGISDAWGLGSSEDINVSSAYRLLGWVYRCVNVRAASLSSMPWSIFRGENEVATGDGDNDTDIAWLDDMHTLLWLVEAGLSIVGEGYLFKDRTRGKRTTGLRMLAADTMTPKWAPDGIQAFERKVNQRTLTIDPERIVYFRLPNPLHETEPGTSPTVAALGDAGVLVNLNAFAAQFFKRGAIKTTIIGLPASTTSEIERVQNWYDRLLAGIKNAWGGNVIQGEFNAIPIGDGIESLNNESLSTEKRENISTAFGIPHSLVMSNAANYATAQADRLNFYDTTIIPEARMIERALNRQLFDEMGLRLRFQPEQMSLYQADENERATAFQAYVNSGLPHSLVAEMLGLALPPGWEYTDLDAEPQTITVVDAEPAPQITMDDAQDDDEGDEDREAKAAEATALRKWLKKRNNPDPDKFVCEYLASAEKSAIVAEVVGGNVESKATRFIPRGADEMLPPVPSTLEITDADIEHAIALWDEVMPDYAGLLDAESNNSAEEL